MRVSIVIPNRNGARLLQKNLPSVMAAAGGHEVIVVDDASTDDSLVVLQKEFPKVRVVKKDKHEGFASTVNVGVAAASGDVVVLLNTDVRPEKNFLPPLLKYFDDGNVFAVGCMDKSVEEGNVILRGRGAARWEKGTYVHSRGEVNRTDTAWVTAGSGAFRKPLWVKLGGMDPIFNPFYWEDIDLSYRAVKAGYNIFFEPKSVVLHEHEEGTIKRDYSPFQVKTVAYRNQFLFVWKNLRDFRGWIEHIIWMPPRLAGAVVRKDLAMLVGFWSALLRSPQMKLAAVLLLAVLVRFYNYENRWGLGYDQAHDAIIARYALENGKIPLVGPFSSAGPFQTGGEWYWIVMLGTAVYPFSILSPWVFSTLLSIVFVVFVVRVASSLYGSAAGLIAGLLAAVSPAGVSQSLNLANQSPLPLVAIAAIWAAIRYGKSKKEKYLFFLGFTVSLAVTIHAQGFALASLVLATLLVAGVGSIRGFLFLAGGGVLPLLPLIAFDLKNQFVNSKGLFRYITQDQFRTSYEQLGRRWLTYLLNLWPAVLGQIIGGNKWIGTISSIAIVGLFGLQSVAKKLRNEEKILLFSVVFAVLILRYVRSPLFDSYFMFFHPFAFILVAGACNQLLKFRVIGLTLLLVLIAGSVFSLKTHILDSRNVTARLVTSWKNELINKYPNQSFALLDQAQRTKNLSVPLSLILYGEGKSSQDGRKIGLAVVNERFELVDLAASTAAELSENQWAPVDPKSIYEETEEWAR